MNNIKPNILFICPYPFDQAPSQRFRYEQYLGLLREKGFNYKIEAFYSEQGWKNLYQKRSLIKKVLAVITGFAKRKFLLFRLKPFDFIFIHREASPLGPPFFEWVARYLWKKKIIYDFDDAIWLSDPNEKGSFIARIKWKSKVARICSWSYRVSCGNEYLANFAQKYNDHVVINPTTIDTEYHKPKSTGDKGDLLTVGWTGTHSTLPYLEGIIDELKEAYQKNAFSLKVIANRKPAFDFPQLNYVAWTKDREIEELQGIDIGLMPLTEDQWSKGKCGFKALQYMALEKPVIASPEGVNENIVPNGGVLVKEKGDWQLRLSELIEDKHLRESLGVSGRMYVKKHYSTESNANNFLYLFSL